MIPNRLLLFAVFVCAPVLTATGADAQLRDTIKAYHKAYIQSLKAGDAEGVAKQFSENAVMLRPNAPMLQGRDSILRDQKEILLRAKVLSGAVQTIQLSQSGDLAYEIGNFSYTVKLDAQSDPVTVGGKFLAVWRRQPDGSWLREAEAGLPQ
ncbi:MAG: nuclear transport factor 2 family protein [Acidobacteriota bacterium]|nr:nuclear transport factor 2 family protein [Acidobacteriota bacterium]